MEKFIFCLCLMKFIKPNNFRKGLNLTHPTVVNWGEVWGQKVAFNTPCNLWTFPDHTILCFICFSASD